MACRWLNEKGPLARAGMAVSMRFGSCRIPYFGVLIITILGYYIRVPDFQKLPFGFRLYIGFKFRGWAQSFGYGFASRIRAWRGCAHTAIQKT